MGVLPHLGDIAFGSRTVLEKMERKQLNVET